MAPQLISAHMLIGWRSHKALQQSKEINQPMAKNDYSFTFEVTNPPPPLQCVYSPL
jgi:hypothetical protein